MRARRPGDSPPALIFGLVACGCAMAWAIGAGLLMSEGLSRPDALGWTLALGGAAVLLAITVIAASLLRGPRVVMAHDPSGARWSLRAGPVPLRLADSSPLAAGSRGAVLATQVVREATRDGAGRRRAMSQAIPLLVRILEVAQRTPGGVAEDDAEWADLRAAVLSFTLHRADRPSPPPVAPGQPPAAEGWPLAS
ncbi:hypothetical protein GCM10009809_25370 [Isoptericola hypogeus]|uniref:Uncharacterized protein n=1 Tax=Isoptericola hypogeus TaxID=300179 RepID=A0ABP4VNE4_9MICO